MDWVFGSCVDGALKKPAGWAIVIMKKLVLPLVAPLQMTHKELLSPDENWAGSWPSCSFSVKVRKSKHRIMVTLRYSILCDVINPVFCLRSALTFYSSTKDLPPVCSSAACSCLTMCLRWEEGERYHARLFTVRCSRTTPGLAQAGQGSQVPAWLMMEPGTNQLLLWLPESV